MEQKQPDLVASCFWAITQPLLANFVKKDILVLRRPRSTK